MCSLLSNRSKKASLFLPLRYSTTSRGSAARWKASTSSSVAGPFSSCPQPGLFSKTHWITLSKSMLKEYLHESCLPNTSQLSHFKLDAPKIRRESFSSLKLTQSSVIDCVSFNELKDSRLIFGASSLKCDSCEVFGRQDSCRYSFNIDLDSVIQCVFEKRPGCGQALNGPATDDDVLAFHLAAEPLEGVEYRRGRNNDAFLLRFESNEHINVESTDRL